MRRLAVACTVCVLCGAAAPARADDAWLGRDKALHFGASAAIAGVSYAGASLVLDEPVERAAVAIGVALLAGVGKEALDAVGPGDASGKDLVWDVAGTLVGAAIAWLIDAAL